MRWEDWSDAALAVTCAVLLLMASAWLGWVR